LTLVAGRGTPGFSGDGGPAPAALLSGPTGLAVDRVGDLFISDSGNSVVREVTPDGKISTVAGNGMAGFSGDGGPATSATLSPGGIAPDQNGNLFIVDSNRIRKVSSNGVITTVAGNGTAGFSGDGGPATSATLSPSGIAADQNGNLFIADTGNNRIRKVSSNGIITTVAGDGTAGFSGDGGPATSAQLLNPLRVAVDRAGNIFITDTGPIPCAYLCNNVVREVTPDGKISTVAGNGMAGFAGDGGPAIAAQFALMLDITVDGNGRLYIADSGNYRIRSVTSAGTISTVAGVGPPSGFLVLYPGGIAFDGNDNLFVANLLRFGIIDFTNSGSPAILASSTAPANVAADALGDVFLIDGSPFGMAPVIGAVRKLTPDGNLTSIGNPSGYLWYFFDYDGASPKGEFCVGGIAVDKDGNLFVTETVRQVIWKFSPTGGKAFAGIFDAQPGGLGDGGPATSAQLNFPNGIATDQNGNLFIADSYNNRVRKVDSNGIITTVAGNGTAGFSGDGGPATSAQLWYPLAVAVDRAGNLFIADSHNSRIRRVDTNGIITTVAGNGTFGFGGDGGPPTSAQLNYPSAVAIDSKGNLFIADSENNSIREVTFTKKVRGQITSQ
jgi:sugar lactone lactonase YvrE